MGPSQTADSFLAPFCTTSNVQCLFSVSVCCESLHCEIQYVPTPTDISHISSMQSTWSVWFSPILLILPVFPFSFHPPPHSLSHSLSNTPFSPYCKSERQKRKKKKKKKTENELLGNHSACCSHHHRMVSWRSRDCKVKSDYSRAPTNECVCVCVCARASDSAHARQQLWQKL